MLVVLRLRSFTIYNGNSGLLSERWIFTMQQQKNTLPVPVSSRVRRGVLQTPNEKIHFRGPRKIFKTEMVLQGNRSGCTTSLLPTHYSRISSSQISLLQQPECDADMTDT
jgi:hypothetical protein